MASPPFESIISFTKTWHNEPYPAISPTRPELSASGKHVVITGGGTGIGKAAAIAFAQANAKSVSIIGRRIDRLQTAGQAIQKANPSTQAILQAGDVTNRASIEAALGVIVAKVGGKIDILLSNAGMLPEAGPVAFAPLAAPGAKLLHTGTSIAHWAPLPEVPGVWSYAATKGAAQKMVDYYASENPHIHVTSFHPGIVRTEINPKIPVGPDTVELPGHFVVWLASGEAAFLRNKFVWANWDVEELKARAEEIRAAFFLRVSLNGVDV
ncbi:putative NAD(P)-binding protein [Seiridium unicorne]|uniref:NAD(P)-binding protein n=1 Tax=Seiridium unicorne TaxID=138068 RepID=A0ABR2UZU4_9PEZI